MNKQILLLIVMCSMLTAALAGAEDVSVVRDLPDTPVNPGGTIVVNLTQTGFLLDVGHVYEVMPDGMEFVHGSPTCKEWHYNPTNSVLELEFNTTSVTYEVIAGTFEQIEDANFSGTYRCVDANGTIVEGSVTGDSTLITDEPPTISIDSPSPLQTFTTADITVSGTASDNIDVVKVEVRVGSESWQPAAGTTSWSKTVTLHLGSNTIYARATDTAGNPNETSVTVTYNKPGDLNNDGKITVVDALIVLEIASENLASDKETADVNHDGRITSLDALMILQAAVDNINLGGT